MKTTVQTIQKIDRISETLFWSLAFAIVLAVFSYMYIIHKTVRNVVHRDTIQTEIVALNSKLSEAEFEYMNTVGDITLDTANELGYVSSIEKVFVTRERIGQNVALR